MSFDNLKQIFSPWIDVVICDFTESFSQDYGTEILEFLHQNIDKEIENAGHVTKKRIRALYTGLTYLYNHFCFKISHQEKSSNVTKSCVKLLSQLIKTSLILSKGIHTSEWLDRVLVALKLFTGDASLVYDALLLVNHLKKKYYKAYIVILKHVLNNEDQLYITEPLVFMKVILLYRRLKSLMKNRYSRACTISMAAKLKPPINLISWLLSLNIDGVNDLKHKTIVKQLMKNKFPDNLFQTVREIVLSCYNIKISNTRNQFRISAEEHYPFVIDNSSVNEQDDLSYCSKVVTSKKKICKDSRSSLSPSKKKKKKNQKKSKKKNKLHLKQQQNVKNSKNKNTTTQDSDAPVFYIDNHGDVITECANEDGSGEYVIDNANLSDPSAGSILSPISYPSRKKSKLSSEGNEKPSVRQPNSNNDLLPATVDRGIKKSKLKKKSNTKYSDSASDVTVVQTAKNSKSSNDSKKSVINQSDDGILSQSVSPSPKKFKLLKKGEKSSADQLDSSVNSTVTPKVGQRTEKSRLSKDNENCYINRSISPVIETSSKKSKLSSENNKVFDANNFELLVGEPGSPATKKSKLSNNGNKSRESSSADACVLQTTSPSTNAFKLSSENIKKSEDHKFDSKECSEIKDQLDYIECINLADSDSSLSIEITSLQNPNSESLKSAQDNFSSPQRYSVEVKDISLNETCISDNNEYMKIENSDVEKGNKCDSSVLSYNSPIDIGIESDQSNSIECSNPLDKNDEIHFIGEICKDDHCVGENIDCSLKINKASTGTKHKIDGCHSSNIFSPKKKIAKVIQDENLCMSLHENTTDLPMSFQQHSMQLLGNLEASEDKLHFKASSNSNVFKTGELSMDSTEMLDKAIAINKVNTYELPKTPTVLDSASDLIDIDDNNTYIYAVHNNVAEKGISFDSMSSGFSNNKDIDVSNTHLKESFTESCSQDFYSEISTENCSSTKRASENNFLQNSPVKKSSPKPKAAELTSSKCASKQNSPSKVSRAIALNVTPEKIACVNAEVGSNLLKEAVTPEYKKINISGSNKSLHESSKSDNTPLHTKLKDNKYEFDSESNENKILLTEQNTEKSILKNDNVVTPLDICNLFSVKTPQNVTSPFHSKTGKVISENEIVHDENILKMTNSSSSEIKLCVSSTNSNTSSPEKLDESILHSENASQNDVLTAVNNLCSLETINMNPCPKLNSDNIVSVQSCNLATISELKLFTAFKSDEVKLSYNTENISTLSSVNDDSSNNMRKINLCTNFSDHDVNNNCKPLPESNESADCNTVDDDSCTEKLVGINSKNKITTEIEQDGQCRPEKKISTKYLNVSDPDCFPYSCNKKDYVTFSNISHSTDYKSNATDSGITNFSFAATAEVFSSYRNDSILGENEAEQIVEIDDGILPSSQASSEDGKFQSNSSDVSDSESGSKHSTSDEIESKSVVNESKLNVDDNVMEDSMKSAFLVVKLQKCDEKTIESDNKDCKSKASKNNSDVNVDNIVVASEENIAFNKEGTSWKSLRLMNETGHIKDEYSENVISSEDISKKEWGFAEMEIIEDSNSKDLVIEKSNSVCSSPLFASSPDSLKSELSKSRSNIIGENSTKAKPITRNKLQEKNQKFNSPTRYSLRCKPKRKRKDISSNLEIDISQLHINSPSSKMNTRSSVSKELQLEKVPLIDTDSSTKSSVDQDGISLSAKRETRSSVISEVLKEDAVTDTPSYNLRTRKSIIAPGKLKL